MSDNNELLKGIPAPGKIGAMSTDTGSVPKVEAEDDDTRTRKTVKLSVAGMMPNAGGKVSPENLAVSRPVPPPTPNEVPAADSSTIRLRPAAPGGINIPKAPGLAPAAAPAAPSTDTGSVPKQAAEDTRTRRTVRISAAAVEDTVKLQRAATPAAAPAAAPVATAMPKPKLAIPKPAAPAPAPKPAAPAAPGAAAAPAADAKTPVSGIQRKEKAELNLKKDEAASKGPSRVAADMAKIGGKKSAGSSEVSPFFIVMGVITVIALVATLVFSSQYLNVWTPDWAGGFTIMPGK